MRIFYRIISSTIPPNLLSTPETKKTVRGHFRPLSCSTMTDTRGHTLRSNSAQLSLSQSSLLARLIPHTKTRTHTLWKRHKTPGGGGVGRFKKNKKPDAVVFIPRWQKPSTNSPYAPPPQQGKQGTPPTAPTANLKEQHRSISSIPLLGLNCSTLIRLPICGHYSNSHCFSIFFFLFSQQYSSSYSVRLNPSLIKSGAGSWAIGLEDCLLERLT